MQEIASALALSVVLILSLGCSQTALACPHPCACYVQTEVHCTFRSLAAVPARIPKHVERINLGFNSIQSISDNSFAGLSKLELLMIHGNDIHAIPNGAFRDLTALQVFKMSYNKVKVISGQTFQGLSGLMRLHIDHNKIEFIHPNAFNGLTSLRLLHLEGNLLQQLHPYTFATFGFLNYFRLSTIKHLYLSENKIQILSEQMMESMPLLESLFLHSNPWSCDCKLKWLLKWDEQSGGVVKCKKDRAYEGGQLCAVCSNPKHLNQRELQTLDDLPCTKPIIYSPLRQNNSNNGVGEPESELSPMDNFQTFLGNVSLNMTDEHGNIVNMACKIKKSSADYKKIQLSQTIPEEIDVNGTFTLDFECPMNRENYEKLWKLIAYYSDVPVKLQRGLMLNKEPKVSYRYKQDMNDDAYYYTGVKAHLLTDPPWLMQPLISLQLNRRKSTATKVTLSFITQFSQMIQVKDVHHEKNSWVMIEQNEKAHVSKSALQGTMCQLSCNVKASESPSIEWMLPNGTKLQAPYSNPGSRISVSSGGQLVIKTVEYSDSGLYHCIAQVRNDMDIMSFRVAVESAVIEPSDTVKVIESNAGEPVMIPCTAIAVPKAQLNWIFPNNNILDHSSNTSRGYVMENGTLLLQNSQLSDSGYYRCAAVNELGADQYAVNVKVNKKESNKSPKLKMKTRPVSKTTTERKEIVITNEGGSGDEELEEVPKKSLNVKDREVSIKQRNNTPSRPGGKKSKKDRRKMKAFKGGQGAEDSNVAEGRRVFESRRRINMGNKQIDPQHWANILAKVRGKNTGITTVTPFLSTSRMTTTAVLRHKAVTPSPIATPPFYPAPGPEAELEESSADGPHLEEDEFLYITTHAIVAVIDEKHEPTAFVQPTIKIPVTQNTDKSIDHELSDPLDDVFTPETESTTNVTPYLTSGDPDHNSSEEEIIPVTEESIISTTEESQDELISLNTPPFSSDQHITSQKSPGDIINAEESQIQPNTAAHAETEINIQEGQSSNVDLNVEGDYVIPIHVENKINVDFLISSTMSTVSSVKDETTTAVINRDAVSPMSQTPTDKQAIKGNRDEPNKRTGTVVGDSAADILTSLEEETLSTESTEQYISPSENVEIAPISTTYLPVSIKSIVIPLEEVGRKTTAVTSRRKATTTEAIMPFLHTTSKLATDDYIKNPRRRPNGRRRLRPNRFRQKPKNFPPSLVTVPETPSIKKPYVTISEVEQSTKSSRRLGSLPDKKHTTELQLEKESRIKTTTLSTTVVNHLQVPAAEDNAVSTSLMRPTVKFSGSQKDMHSASGAATTPPTSTTTTTTTTTKATSTTTTSTATTTTSITSSSTSPSSTSAITTKRTSKSRKLHTTSPITTQAKIKNIDRIATHLKEQLDQKSRLATYNNNLLSPPSENDTDSTSHTEFFTSKTTPSNPVQALTTEPPIHFAENVHHFGSQEEDLHMPSPVNTSKITTSPEPIVFASTPFSSMNLPNIVRVQKPTTRSKSLKTVTVAPVHMTRKTITMSPLYNSPAERVTKQNDNRIFAAPLFPVSTTTKLPKREVSRSMSISPHKVMQRRPEKIESTSTAIQIASVPLAQPATLSPLIKNVTLPASVPAQATKNGREHITFNQIESPVSAKIDSHENKLIPRKNEPGISFSNQNRIHTNLNQKQSKDIYSGRLNNTVLLNPHSRRQPGITTSFNQWPVVVPPHYNQIRGTIRPPSTPTRGTQRLFMTNSPLQFTNKPEITAFAAEKAQQRKTQTQQPATAPFQMYRPNPILPGRFSNPGNSRTTLNHRLFGNNYATDGKGTPARKPHHSLPYYINPRIPLLLNRTRTFNRLLSTSKPLTSFLPKTPIDFKDKSVAIGSSISVTVNSVIKATVALTLPVNRMTSTHKVLTTTQFMTTTPSPIPQRLTPRPAPTVFIRRNNYYNNQYVPLGTNVEGSNTNSAITVQSSGSSKTLKDLPKIMSRGYQTLAIAAEMDALFPCDTVGEPKPFLTWTKVSTGATMTVNTKIQRFEVLKNGTFVIRNVQLQDRGQYLCTAQNEYGVDKMVITLTVVAQQPKLLVPRYRDATIYLGETVTMECTCSGTPTPHISWFFPDRKIIRTSTTTDGRIKLFENGTLTIEESTFSDRGIYKCIVSNVAGTDSLTVRLHIAALPPIIQHEKEENISLPAGHSVYIHCSAKAAPPPTIRWVLFDGTQVRPSQFVNGNLFVFPNGTLYIRSISPRDSGNYECIAANIVGAVRRIVNLSVKKSSSNAKITRSSPQKTDITYGSTLRLDCSADGDPGPRILWRLPSKRLVDSLNSFDSRTRVYGNGTLIVQSVTDKDAGDYLCVARNKIGDDYVVLKVNVMMKPAKIEHKNELNHKISYGGDLKVDCIATGLPNPEISWSLPDGSMINNLMQSDDNGARTRRYVVFNNGTLFFNEVGMKEEGDYTCYAVNQIGQDEMRVSIKVVGEQATIRNKTFSVINVSYGDVVILPCEAKGEPIPKVTWLSPTNRPISAFSNKYQVQRDGTLFIQKAQRSDSGNYTCLVRNDAGEDKKIVHVHVNVQSPKINGYMNSVTIIQETGMKDARKMIDCKADGIPAPRVLWAFPEGVILPAPYYGNRITVHRNGTLDIKFLRKTDSVQLVCIGRNEGGEARLIVQLTVTDHLQKPSFKSNLPEKLAMAAGHAVSLDCSVEGVPDPAIIWILPNGTELQSGHHLHRLYHRKNGTLYISSLSTADAGVYRCIARNMVGYSEMQVSLKVGPKPEISSQYNNLVSIINGGTLQLHCITQGHLRPHISWILPNGMQLSGSQAGGRFSILENGTLIVRDASVYDRGTYLCKANTEYGASVMNVPVIVIAYPPRITSGPAPVIYTQPGNAVQLNCMTIGIPKAEITWELPDKSQLTTAAQSRLYGNKFLHPQGTLVIQHPLHKDAGFYKCTAKNLLGSDSKTTYIHVL